MKKIIFLIAVICTFNTSSLKAQFEKGKRLIGVSSNLGLAGSGSSLLTIGYSKSKVKTSVNNYGNSSGGGTFSFNLLPKFGYFVSNNFAIGLDLTLALNMENDKAFEGKNTTFLINVGPFMRYYVPTNNVRPFIEGSAAIGKFMYKSESNYFEDSESTSNVSSLGLGVGVAIPINEKAMFDVLASFSSFSEQDTDDHLGKIRYITSSLGLKLGFIILLGSD